VINSHPAVLRLADGQPSVQPAVVSRGIPQPRHVPINRDTPNVVRAFFLARVHRLQVFIQYPVPYVGVLIDEPSFGRARTFNIISATFSGECGKVGRLRVSKLM